MIRLSLNLTYGLQMDDKVKKCVTHGDGLRSISGFSINLESNFNDCQTLHIAPLCLPVANWRKVHEVAR